MIKERVVRKLNNSKSNNKENYKSKELINFSSLKFLLII